MCLQPLPTSYFCKFIDSKISLTLSDAESGDLPQAKRNFQKGNLSVIIYLNSSSYLYVYTYHKYLRPDKIQHRNPWYSLENH